MPRVYEIRGLTQDEAQSEAEIYQADGAIVDIRPQAGGLYTMRATYPDGAGDTSGDGGATPSSAGSSSAQDGAPSTPSTGVANPPPAAGSAINRKFFFDEVRSRLFGGHVQDTQLQGMTAILDYWESQLSGHDDRWLAYVLATAYHETAQTMQPIEEFGKGKGRPYGKPDPQTGQTYYGRGFVQLTWKTNYQIMGGLVHEDLVQHPELALRLNVATEIIFVGMIEGKFTGRKLGDYFSAAKDDWVNAREIVNGHDRAGQIAQYGHGFYAAIAYTT